MSLGACDKYHLRSTPRYFLQCSRSK